MFKIVEGFCPFIEAQHKVRVYYNSTSTFNDESYTKGLADCKYKMNGKCEINDCPIFSKAPNNI